MENKEYDGSDKAVLERFLKEHFDFKTLKKIGVFKDIKHNDYEAQAKRLCKFFDLKTIYEYGKDEISCHLSYSGERPENDKEFITVIPSIYD